MANVVQAKNAAGSDDPILQYVTFRLADETYGINVMQVQEVLRYTEIAPVPGAPSYVLGIINLRGNVVTVIDTRQRFGLMTAETTDSTRIVIIEVDQQVVCTMTVSAVATQRPKKDTIHSQGSSHTVEKIVSHILALINPIHRVV